MKLNWGTGIAIFIGLFIITMVSMVFKAGQQSHELVTTDYYAKELDFQHLLEKKKRTSATFKQPILTQFFNNQLLLTFPDEVGEQPIVGSIYFFKASNQSKDLTLPIKTQNRTQNFDVNSFSKGKYTLKIEWNVAENEYYSEIEVVFP
ncbi:MAG: hypothetical protein CVT95_10295 [Bacteroidetes bacterium HGW-Bacteroidetes-12]|nr:MAG: hypothetical protein CVT95_10295 [Bacteroidetes bacterium HGW-Bacteroidetes-12]